MPPTNGAKIRSIRRAKGLRLGEVAKALGIRSNNLCNIENGHRGASHEVINLLARVLDVPAIELMAETEVPRDPAA